MTPSVRFRVRGTGIWSSLDQDRSVPTESAGVTQAMGVDAVRPPPPKASFRPVVVGVLMAGQAALGFQRHWSSCSWTT